MNSSGRKPIYIYYISILHTYILYIIGYTNKITCIYIYYISIVIYILYILLYRKGTL